MIYKMDNLKLHMCMMTSWQGTAFAIAKPFARRIIFHWYGVSCYLCWIRWRRVGLPVKRDTSTLFGQTHLCDLFGSKETAVTHKIVYFQCKLYSCWTLSTAWIITYTKWSSTWSGRYFREEVIPWFFSVCASVSRTGVQLHEIDIWLDPRSLSEFYGTLMFPKVNIIVT